MNCKAIFVSSFLCAIVFCVYPMQKPQKIDIQAIKARSQQLLKACDVGNIKEVRRLLAEGVDIDVTDGYGVTPLIIASKKGHDDIAKILIAAGANINIVSRSRSPEDKTALMAAASSGSAEILDALIKDGADINIKDSYGINPLMRAAQGGHANAVKVLIQAGVDVNAKASDKNTAITLAAQRGHSDVIRLLIDAGANLNVQNQHKNTPLILALNSKDINVAKILIEAGADVNIGGDRGETALMLALKRRSDIEVVKALVDAGADVNRPADGELPLAWSIKANNAELVKFLIEAGADVYKSTGSYKHPDTPFVLAIKTNNKTNNMSTIMACLNPVVNPEVKEKIKTILMVYQRPESVLSMLPKDILKLIIVYIYPEYVKKFGMNLELLAGVELQILVDRLPLELLAELIKIGVLDRDAVVEAWKQKVDKIIQTLRASKANLGEAFIIKFKNDFLAHINVLFA